MNVWVCVIVFVSVFECRRHTNTHLYAKVRAFFVEFSGEKTCRVRKFSQVTFIVFSS